MRHVNIGPEIHYSIFLPLQRCFDPVEESIYYRDRDRSLPEMLDVGLYRSIQQQMREEDL